MIRMLNGVMYILMSKRSIDAIQLIITPGIEAIVHIIISAIKILLRATGSVL